jgi:hypothetical protein
MFTFSILPISLGTMDWATDGFQISPAVGKYHSRRNAYRVWHLEIDRGGDVLSKIVIHWGIFPELGFPNRFG